LAQLLVELDAALAALPACSAAVLCGDLNTCRDSPAVRALTSHAALRLEHAATPSFTTWKFRTAHATANGNGNSSGACPPAALFEKAEAIDHVLHTPALTPVAAWGQPAREAIGEGALPSEGYPSDHIAQLIEFQWGALDDSAGGGDS
jgi:endonuclease/exonuclease/phosphatase family metal-dependent hydrolase